ncbi:hypothetical protein H7F15_02485 [Pontibacter sp. Tf4]|uniref:hypothetical protein n=1 Tax=Pontibacter sp. Tf4 TaxID=2761620 RepID=UPI0016255E0F|nr:hypothetical protein [Pontibacter sp. Tf4]MBB6609894.1 hypothetical protein [Pontibacter sp. Tf4]
MSESGFSGFKDFQDWNVAIVASYSSIVKDHEQDRFTCPSRNTATRKTDLL